MQQSDDGSTRDRRSSALAAFRKALSREVHVLRQRPDLLWQQLHNRLQWEEEQLPSLSSEREKRTAPGTTPWVSLRIPLGTSDALVRTLEGHRHSVEACAFSADGFRVATGGQDRTCRV